uniref:Uncharacterized protein n=1 Tax=Kalanchoe fedtschenkoi TaxID=63787 RepID=A0A7N0UNY1_KALFE
MDKLRSWRSRPSRGWRRTTKTTCAGQNSSCPRFIAIAIAFASPSPIWRGNRLILCASKIIGFSSSSMLLRTGLRFRADTFQLHRGRGLFLLAMIDPSPTRRKTSVIGLEEDHYEV